jgi:hypothetical protein
MQRATTSKNGVYVIFNISFYHGLVHG